MRKEVVIPLHALTETGPGIEGCLSPSSITCCFLHCQVQIVCRVFLELTEQE